MFWDLIYFYLVQNSLSSGELSYAGCFSYVLSQQVFQNSPEKGLLWNCYEPAQFRRTELRGMFKNMIKQGNKKPGTKPGQKKSID